MFGRTAGVGPCEAAIRRRRAARAVPELSVFVGIPTFIGYKSCLLAMLQESLSLSPYQNLYGEPGT